MSIREIQSGDQNNLLASLARAGLAAASIPYGMVVRQRNRAFDQGRREVILAEVPVVCVGNLTTGGTGKTPIVRSIARWLRDQGVRVCLVSRGYGSDRSGINDEALELEQQLPDVPHVQNPDRVEAAWVAVEELDTQFILMDDGYQHRRLHRDLDIAVVDATNPFGFDHLLPRGLLREPLTGLNRAGIVVLTRTDAVSANRLQSIEKRLAEYISSQTPILRCIHAPKSLLTYPDQFGSLESLEGRRVVAISAIGNPAAFENTLAELMRSRSGELMESIRFPDHDPYSPEAIGLIKRTAEQINGGFDQFICTHKDLVKLGTDRIAGKPLSSLQIELQWISDPTPLHDRLRNLISNFPKEREGPSEN